MAWIKHFRKEWGLSQFQLAQFAGVTRSYLADVEVQNKVPESVNPLFRELKELFEEVDISADLTTPVFLQGKTKALITVLRDSIEKKEIQLAACRLTLKSLDKRYRELLILKEVCRRWKSRKQAVDPNLAVKMGFLEKDQHTELRKCGPEARAKIRIRMARIAAEMEISKEELIFFTSLAKPVE